MKLFYWSFFALFYWNMFQILHCCVNYRAFVLVCETKKQFSLNFSNSSGDLHWSLRSLTFLLFSGLFSFFTAFIKYCIILWFPYSTDSTLEQFRLTKEIKYLLKSFSLSVYLKKMDRGSHDKWQRSAISFSVNVLLHWLKNILY